MPIRSKNQPEDTDAQSHRAMGTLVRDITACQSALYAYICSLLGTSSAAADVLQETNLVLWEKAAEYDTGRPFLPWAYRIAYFQVLAHRKRLSRDKLLFDDAMLATVSDAIRQRHSANRELEALDGCLEKLPQRNRSVVDARYRDAEPLEAVARRVGRAPNAVAAELYRTRKLLADCVRQALAKWKTS